MSASTRAAPGAPTLLRISVLAAALAVAGCFGASVAFAGSTTPAIASTAGDSVQH